MTNIDHPNALYLGREYDLAAGQILPTPLLYDSSDLTTHAVCVGMTGSGKTGLCLSLLEEAALHGVPAIAIDPKGDLANLLLAFPELQPQDFLPWIDQSAARREGRSPEEQAAKTAERWRQGLAQWNQDGQRIRRFTEAVDRTIYTPGSSSGVPLSVLKSFAAPPAAVLGDGDALRDRIDAAATGLLGLLGIQADAATSREHILMARLLEDAWRAGRDLDLASLIHAIQQPSFQRVGVIDLETFFPAAERLKLGIQINNLLASPASAAWLEEPIDVARLLHTEAGQPRLSIISIAHLDDAQRMFFVTLLLNEVISWMRSQPGASSLRAILYMDEVFGYFPPTANPPSKRPLLTLMKQARAFGLGCVLATQNPVDLDYKGLSNAGTWFLGRLQTERDKLRVLDGLEGASAEAGAAFNRQRMEATLAALDQRVFLMNNVHLPAPKIFHTRWAMSYLAGPLTRTQISALMAPRKQQSASELADRPPLQPRALSEGRPLSQQAVPSPKDIHPPAAPGATERTSPSSLPNYRPVVSAEIKQRFLQLDPEVVPSPHEQLVYRPALIAIGKLHYVKSSQDIDHWQSFAALQPIHGQVDRPAWATAMIFYQCPRFADDAASSATFAELPADLAQPKNYRRWDDDLIDHLYQTERFAYWICNDPKARSHPEETEGRFRDRIAELKRQDVGAQRDAIRKKYASQIEKQQQRVAAAEAKVAQEKAQFWTRLGGMIGRAAEVSLSTLFGRKSRKRIVTSTSAGAAVRDRQQQTQAQRRLDDEMAKLESLRAAEQEELARLDAPFGPGDVVIEKVELPPRKSDITVDEVALAWVPWLIDSNGTARPAY